MRRILVVDDDRMVCAAIEIYLERHGFDVTIADGGEAGLRALEDSCFDLMLVDIFMPHMRGFESIRIFHERAPTVPLIAMSGYAFANLASPAPDFLRMAIELGAARCLRNHLQLRDPRRRLQWNRLMLSATPSVYLDRDLVDWDYGDYEGVSSDLIRKDNPEMTQDVLDQGVFARQRALRLHAAAKFLVEPFNRVRGP